MSFTHDIIRKLKQNPDQNIITEVLQNGNRSYTRQKFFIDAQRVYKQLKNRHIKKSDRICLIGPNSYQWIVTDLSIVAMGAISVPLYHRQDPKELAYIIDEVEPVLTIFFDEELKNQIQKYTNFQTHFSHISFFFSDKNETTMTDFPQINDTLTATMIYTSGTSGNPKGVMLSHKSVKFMLIQTKSRLVQAKFGSNKKDIIFHYLPFCFAGSRMMLWTQLHRGNEIHLSMDLQNLAQEIQSINPNYYLNVPTLLERIKQGVEKKITSQPIPIQRLFNKSKTLWQKYQDDNITFLEKLYFFLLRKTVLTSIKHKIGTRLEFLICGSAPLHPDTQSWFEMIGIPVYQVYGLTETTAIVTMDMPELVRKSYVGVPIEGIQTKVSQDGELLTKGPHIFQGYYKNDEQTQNVIRDGWFHTGDIAQIDSENRIKILGRINNVIIPSSGHNIVPEPLEEFFTSLDTNIEYACIVGHGQPKIGIIVSGTLTTTQLDQIVETYNLNQPHYKKLGFSILVEQGFFLNHELLTANQKLKRRHIEAYFESQVAQKLKESA
ncbi:MAG: AMP-binding protein [Bdellovibrionales bacterium]|nr:AMP-binding protein [Bdellovibrionales bacterium]